MRAGVAGSPNGLLLIAAGLILGSGMAGFEWTVSYYLLPGEVVIFGSAVPNRWLFSALLVSAWVTVAVVALGATDSPRSRRRAVVLSAPLYGLVCITPGVLFLSGLPYLHWASHVLVDSIVTILVMVGSTWIGLRVLTRLQPVGRRRALAAALALLGAMIVVEIWPRDGGSSGSALADLEAAAFITAFAVLLAVIALARAWRPGRPVQTAPAAHDRAT